jgi:hypothetical protein
MLKNKIKLKVQEYLSEQNFLNYQTLYSYINFFMIFLLTFKSNINFILYIFDKNNNYFNELTNTLKELPNNINNNFLSILNNIFFSEYKEMFLLSIPNKELENIFLTEHINFLNNKVQVKFFYDELIYKKMYDILFEFEISYENFFANNKDIDVSDKSIYRMCLSQSVIHVIFSKKKLQYYKNNNKYYYYEFFILKKIIDKDMQETKKIYGDKYKTLFRKEDICDDIIKYMFFIFGNSMIIESFIKPLNNVINTNEEEERNITKNEYDNLLDEIVKNLINTMPLILKIMLKLVYISVNEHFTLEKDNYSPLYTLLIFNFIISPKIQTIYNINIKCNFIKQLGKLLKNTGYNIKFEENDSFYSFNDLIEKNNKKLKNFIEYNILSIDFENNNNYIKNYLKDFFNEENLIYPKYLFYWDSKLICEAINGGVQKLTNYKKTNSF